MVEKMNNKKNLKDRVIFTVWLLLFVLMVFCFFSWLGCTGDYEKGWAWGVITENGEQVTQKFLWNDHEVRVDDILLIERNPHLHCKEKHYIDPYTKKEYCLPEDFINIEQLHLYRVEKEND